MTWDQPTTPLANISALFAIILKLAGFILARIYFEEALRRHNLSIIWNNIESDLRKNDGRYKINDRGNEWYVKETFPRVMQTSYVLDRKNFLSFIDDVLIEISKTRLVRPYLSELRARLKSLEFDDECIDKMAIFRDESR